MGLIPKFGSPLRLNLLAETEKSIVAKLESSAEPKRMFRMRDDVNSGESSSDFE
jgi:hypothetical protein